MNIWIQNNVKVNKENFFVAINLSQTYYLLCIIYITGSLCMLSAGTKLEVNDCVAILPTGKCCIVWDPMISVILDTIEIIHVLVN